MSKNGPREPLKGFTERPQVAVGLLPQVPVQGLLRLRLQHSPTAEDLQPLSPPPCRSTLWARAGAGAGAGQHFGLFQSPGPRCYNPRATVSYGLRRHCSAGPGVCAGLDLAPRGATLRPEPRNHGVASWVTLTLSGTTVPENARPNTVGHRTAFTTLSLVPSN